jgi:hypothetical protein
VLTVSVSFGRVIGLASGAGGCGSLSGDLDKLMDVLGAAPATAVTLEVKLGFELVGRHDSNLTSCSDFRFGDSFAQAHVHGIPPSTIMRSIISMPEDERSVNLPENVKLEVC